MIALRVSLTLKIVFALDLGDPCACGDLRKRCSGFAQPLSPAGGNSRAPTPVSSLPRKRVPSSGRI